MPHETPNKLEELTAIKIAKITDDYFIDSDGNIYSRPRFGSRGGLLKHSLSGESGMRYFSVRMTINGKKCHKMVHCLLAQAFIPNPKKYPEVNHKDGNKLNNRLENLEWCTSSQNMKHAWDTELRKKISATGMRYIYVDKANNKFRVIISGVKGKKDRLGRFVTLQLAINARDKWLREAK